MHSLHFASQELHFPGTFQTSVLTLRVNFPPNLCNSLHKELCDSSLNGKRGQASMLQFSKEAAAVS